MTARWLAEIDAARLAEWSEVLAGVELSIREQAMLAVGPDVATLTAFGDKILAAREFVDRGEKLVAALRAAVAMRGEGYEPRPGVVKVQAFDAAIAALDAETDAALDKLTGDTE